MPQHNYEYQHHILTHGGTFSDRERELNRICAGGWRIIDVYFSPTNENRIHYHLEREISQEDKPAK